MIKVFKKHGWQDAFRFGSDALSTKILCNSAFWVALAVLKTVKIPPSEE